MSNYISNWSTVKSRSFFSWERGNLYSRKIKTIWCMFFSRYLQRSEIAICSDKRKLSKAGATYFLILSRPLQFPLSRGGISWPWPWTRKIILSAGGVWNAPTEWFEGNFWKFNRCHILMWKNFSEFVKYISYEWIKIYSRGKHSCLSNTKNYL